ncbi:hypothetical protein [Methanosarcina barkeri]|uniref:hypothetical protein n=1 Tax=Methanosarcina barkeri TaxID=2208 RepID=UPI0012D40E10|nr:hypothetical protein [Methanosarcina barkeri]
MITYNFIKMFINIRSTRPNGPREIRRKRFQKVWRERFQKVWRERFQKVWRERFQKVWRERFQKVWRERFQEYQKKEEYSGTRVPEHQRIREYQRL